MARLRRDTVTFPIVVRELEVLRVQEVTPGMRRVTLTGPQLEAFTTRNGIDVPALRNDGFDDHVKVFVPPPGEAVPSLPVQATGHLDWAAAGERPIAKDYTPRRYDPVRGELDLDFVRHGTGFASTWAERVRPGDGAWIAGPKSSDSLPRDVDWLLVAGDETALPAIGRLLDELPQDARAQVFVEIGEESHRQDLRVLPGVEITWLVRHGAAPGTTDLLERAVRGATWWSGDVFAWLAGEALTLKPIRAHLREERQVPRDCLHVTGYWRRTEVRAAVDGVPAADDDGDDTHERLHALADVTGGLALRAAVTLGVLQRLARGPAEVDEVATITGTARGPLRALLTYLVTADVLEHRDGRFALGPLGHEVLEDEHSLHEYDLHGAAARFALAVTAIEDVLLAGRPAERARDLMTDPALAAQSRDVSEDAALWFAPSVLQQVDWRDVRHLSVMGPGSGHVAAAVLRDHAQVTATLVGLPSVLDVVVDACFETGLRGRVDRCEQSELAPLSDVTDTVLAVELLERLADPDAVLVLRQLADSGASRIEVVEPVLPAVDDMDEEDAEHDLLRWCAHGVGARTAAQVETLLRAADLGVDASRDVGWGRWSWTVSPG